jgi:hypothetical protein
MILSKLKLVENIVNEISDNSTGQISPHDIRHNLLDIIDSVHLLTAGNNLKSANFETPSTRSTRVGESTLEKLGLDGYYSVDNSAFGYSSLKANYQGVRNTAIGSHSLICNVYGEDNVALGHQSLAGNTVGFANVGLGNYTLNNQKAGNFNIAIGHGAGYYADKETYGKLFIASHPVDGQYICDNPLGSGLTPLVYGDLNSLKFGIAVNALHSYGTLQVSGGISPSIDNIFNLGHSLYRFNNAYIGNSIVFNNGVVLSCSGDYLNSYSILPTVNRTYRLGSTSRRWQEGHFENLYVSGEAFINKLTSISSSTYVDKTLYLATSGASNSGYLNDEQLLGAGFIVNSSGADYLRAYKFTFGTNRTQHCETNSIYSTAFWNSNISLHLDSGNHIEVDRIVSNRNNNLSLLTPSSCYGLFLYNNNNTFISRKENLLSDVFSSSGHLAGISNINYLSTSGSLNNYSCTIGAIESGVTVSQRFLTGIKKRVKDTLNNNKDKLSGFELQYIDDSNSLIGGTLTDRLVIGSYNNTSEFINGLTVMKNSQNEGVIGITNLTPLTKNILPETMLNMRSVSNCVARLTAENNGNTKAALQLLGGSNCLNDGLELEYSNASGLADLSLYKDSGKAIFLRFKENGEIGLLSSGITNSTLTIGHSGIQTIPCISLRDDTFTTNGITSTANYGKIYVLRQNRGYANQYNSIYLMDGSGNIFDLVINGNNSLDGRAIYSNLYNPSLSYGGNTFAGYLSVSGRLPLADQRLANTAFGSHALYGLASGDYNSVFGTAAGSGINNGNKNTIIGSLSATAISSGFNNIVIGANSFNNTSGNVNNNIIIGTDLSTSSGTNHRFIVGNNNVILLDGTLGPANADKQLTLPSGGKLFINDSTNTDSLLLRTNIIEVVDRGGNNYPDNTLTFKFTGNQSADLLMLNHSQNPMSNSPIYSSSNNPSATLNGDLRLRGAIKFSDNTSLDSASFLSDISNLKHSGIVTDGNISYLYNSFVEGYVQNIISAPTSASQPTSGSMILKNSNWANGSTVNLINRDTTSEIHAGAYVVAIRVNNQYRPIWISAKDTNCVCCNT